MLCGCTVNSLNECRRICTGLPVGLTPVQSHTCAAACRSGRSLRKHLLLKLQRPLADERAGSVKVSQSSFCVAQSALAHSAAVVRDLQT